MGYRIEQIKRLGPRRITQYFSFLFFIFTVNWLLLPVIENVYARTFSVALAGAIIGYLSGFAYDWVFRKSGTGSGKGTNYDQ